jgi:hypothetical protein
MATADVDMDLTVTSPPANWRPPWGLTRAIDMRKSPDTRERISM